jgi:hypothetical protein
MVLPPLLVQWETNTGTVGLRGQVRAMLDNRIGRRMLTRTALFGKTE